MANIILDIDDNTIFIPNQWIGQGKIFKDIPLYVHDALSNATAIPDYWKPCRPAGDLPVSAFLQEKFPKQSQGFVAHKHISCFSKYAPNTNINFLATQPVPPSDWINKLLETGGQEWLNGTQSFTDPCFNLSHDHLPLWAITYWKEMADAQVGITASAYSNLAEGCVTVTHSLEARIFDIVWTKSGFMLAQGGSIIHML